ncbi:hypothetical protein FGW37_05565 [Streptomyces rectiverticillatus]|uniref:IS3 family transposase n=1 Tax=Streptomyces rectiverticillatus TaxID=173860 RepID=UPI0015C2E974|nr:IS3 family transposase [Streptomyces rectiverticillatus]QLE71141.1 hypothetical protein FGW37_05565 [Streptomyces rectiverticillatus]
MDQDARDGGGRRPGPHRSVLKVEYVYRHTFATRTGARLRIATWITGFYNTHRLHSVCGYYSPIDYEKDHRANSDLEPAA